MIPPDEVLAARSVRRALDRFAQRDPTPLSQGLSPENARYCLDLALEVLTVEALSEAASGHPGRARPDSVAVVVAQGVFTSPVEWVALYVTAGIAVHLKAPATAPEACLALAHDLAAQGLPVTASTDRDLSGHPVIVAFGGDATGPALARAWPDARVVAFGHRVSAAVVAPQGPLEPLARALALDCVAFDGRGCMAPVAVLALDRAQALAAALAAALERLQATLPPGPLDPALGPEWRRRLALARVLGHVYGGQGWAVPVLPPGQLVPAALPRMLPVIPADDLSPLHGLPLSSLAVQGHAPLHAAAARLAPRLVAPGQLQQPRIPRLHDGVDMLGCVLR